MGKIIPLAAIVVKVRVLAAKVIVSMESVPNDGSIIYFTADVNEKDNVMLKGVLLGYEHENV